MNPFTTMRGERKKSQTDILQLSKDAWEKLSIKEPRIRIFEDLQNAYNPSTVSQTLLKAGTKLSFSKSRSLAGFVETYKK